MSPRRGYRTQPRVSTLGNIQLTGSPSRGEGFTGINPIHIARQKGSCVCLAALEAHLEKSFCDDGFPARRWMKKLIPWRIGRQKTHRRFRSDKRVPGIGLPSTAKMDFDFGAENDGTKTRARD